MTDAPGPGGQAPIRSPAVGKAFELAGDERALSPVVGKTLELGIVVLFVGLLTTVLLAGVVPDYRTATGKELGERVLTTAAQEIEHAVPPDAQTVSTTRDVDLPNSIRGASYRIRVDGRSLVLDHPHREIGGRVRVSLPARVKSIDGSWQSGAEPAVRVTDSGTGGLAVRLVERDP